MRARFPLRQPSTERLQPRLLHALDRRVDLRVLRDKVAAMEAVADHDGLLGRALEVRAVRADGRLAPGVALAVREEEVRGVHEPPVVCAVRRVDVGRARSREGVREEVRALALERLTCVGL